MPSSVRAGACAPCLPAPAIFLDLFKKAAGLSCSAELRKYSVPRGDGGCTVRISVGFLLWTSRCLWKQGDKNKGWNWTIHSRELHEAPWPCLQTRRPYCSWQLTYSFSSSSVHAPHAPQHSFTECYKQALVLSFLHGPHISPSASSTF